MQSYLFKLRDIGEGITEAEIAQWHVKAGERVAEGQTLVDVLTDKATVDLASPVAGQVLSIKGEVGERIAVGSTLVEIALDEPATEVTSQVLAAPATRQRAKELGINLEHVKGTGPDGRVLPADLENSQIDTDEANTVQDHQIIGLRRKIAERMQLAKRQIPHFSYVEELDLTELVRVRATLNQTRSPEMPKLTLLPFFMRAMAQAISEFPQLNAHYLEERSTLRVYKKVHIGIATQTPQGLLVPVIHDAGSLDLWQSATQIVAVTEAARAGTASREILSGSTITLTSLGSRGGIAATPIINYPEVAIIGPNRLEERAVVRDGAILIRSMLNLSASFDHRIIDGYEAAGFIQRLKLILEAPQQLL
jgi:2-oxoisovalerate dehydrogenase E2 component (dihydrolipoyl transacylase)